MFRSTASAKPPIANCSHSKKVTTPTRRLNTRADSPIMFGPFRMTNPLSSGLLWKIPWRMSKFQKRRQRQRLRAVDSVVATVDAALARQGQTLEALERWKSEMPTEAEMLPKDKYTMFDRKAKRYRKGIHSEWFWTGYEVRTLTRHRATQVDESITENQPSRLLMCLFRHNQGPRLAKTRTSGITRPGAVNDQGLARPSVRFGRTTTLYNNLFDIWMVEHDGLCW